LQDRSLRPGLGLIGDRIGRGESTVSHSVTSLVRTGWRRLRQKTSRYEFAFERLSEGAQSRPDGALVIDPTLQESAGQDASVPQLSTGLVPQESAAETKKGDTRRIIIPGKRGGGGTRPSVPRATAQRRSRMSRPRQKAVALENVAWIARLIRETEEVVTVVPKVFGLA
jgi:hypothetical protein